jgi:hypothetical protein
MTTESATELATDSTTGILAIWNRCVASQLSDYETWYQTEHLAERLSIPGFIRGRRYEAIPDGSESPADETAFFTYYETDNASILTSEPYLQRVNHPTPMTANIMRHAFTDMSRTICRQRYVIGSIRGAFAVTVQLDSLPDPAQLRDLSQSAPAAIARVEAWQAVESTVPASTEAKLRGGDAQISACLLVETLREAPCHAVLKMLRDKFTFNESQATAFRLLCEVTSQ